MSNIFNSDDFGLKIYNRFPPKYREDDVGQNFALKRFLESMSEGGFKHSIDEINGITNLIDPDNADSEVLPILFKQYGFELFNGLPIEYLRYLLPRLGETWSKKGTLSVVELITSSISGIKSRSSVEYDKDNNPIIDVRFEMDYDTGLYFPETGQFSRLLERFIPFYCDINVLCSYMFYDNSVLVGKDNSSMNIQRKEGQEGASLNLVLPLAEEDISKNSLLGEALLGSAVFGISPQPSDMYWDIIRNKNGEIIALSASDVLYENLDKGSLTNVLGDLLNTGFYTNDLM